MIPIEHKANANESEIRVLALTLRDGVLLCNLINFLDAKAGLDFNRKPQMAQVCVFVCNIALIVDDIMLLMLMVSFSSCAVKTLNSLWTLVKIISD